MLHYSKVPFCYLLQIKSELESYDTSGGMHVCGWFCWRNPMSTGGRDAKSVFRVSTSDKSLYT